MFMFLDVWKKKPEESTRHINCTNRTNTSEVVKIFYVFDFIYKLHFKRMLADLPYCVREATCLLNYRITGSSYD